MSKSSLSSVVSNLVRASMGASVSNTVTDEDLDRHVAELILKEAKQKAEKYGKDGIRAYLPNVSDPNVPRTNKRFLSSIIRSTDDHNKTILRTQALAAQEIKREREEEERRERRVRAEEAVEAERMRRLMGGGRRDGWSTERDREGGRDRDKDRGKERGFNEGRRRRERSWERYEDNDTRNKEERRSGRHRSPRGSSSGHRHSRHVSRERDDTSDERRKRRHRHESEERRGDSQPRFYGIRRRSSRSASPRHQRERSSTTNTSAQDIRESRKHSRSRSPISDAYQAGESALKSRSRSPSTEARLDSLINGHSLPSKLKPQSPSSSHTRSPSHSPPRSRPFKSSNLHVSTSYQSSKFARLTSPSPTSPAPTLPSKMDKYFEPSYDPRLDTAPLAVPSIPSTGLVSDAAFEGWDLMLEVIKARREEKEERKRLERMGISKEQTGKKSKKKGALAMETSGGESIMDIEYKKRGSVREWDMGKEGF